MITIQPSQKAPFRRVWQEGVAVGRAYELLRADVQAHLRRIQSEIGFRGCRFHGLFHDDMQVAIRDPEGKLRFQWNQVAKIFDFMLEVGLTPFVELNCMPGALASGSETFFYWRMNVTPPRDWTEWEQLVESFGRFIVRRYGLEEVRKWHFEVWNEPNLTAFWSGTREQYDELFRASRRALHRVDPSLKVGGPASAEGGWIDGFLETHGDDADFISTHLYPMNEYATFETREESTFVPGRYMIDRLKGIRRQVAGRPLYITEWNSLDAPDAASVDWFDNPTIDGIASGAVTARMAMELDEVVDGLFWWVASDLFEEAGMPQSPFSGTYGMVTIDGIPKPSFHAFRFAQMLKGVPCEVLGNLREGTGMTAVHDLDCTRALLWNHVPAGLDGDTWSESVKMSGFEGGIVTVLHVKPGKGSAYESWIEMGRPQNPTPAQMQSLKAASEPETWSRELPAGGEIELCLGPNEIAFVEWAPSPDPYIPKEILSVEADHWNSSLAAVPSLKGDLG